MWDATSGGNQIHSIALQESGGAPTNQIASVSDKEFTVNYTYDAAGNVTDDGAHIYGYDSENRIVSVDGGSTASYGYDNQNRRYKKTIGSTVTHYVWQGSQVLAEHNGSTGTVLTDYVYSGSRMIAKVASSTTSYFLNDRLSARLTLNTSGAVVGRQAHLAFGEDFGESGAQEKHHFTSYERDVETGTDYAVNRGYSPNVGRFQQADSFRSSGYLANPQSWNRYAYVHNDPANLVDPMGLEGFSYPWPDRNFECIIYPSLCEPDFISEWEPRPRPPGSGQGPCAKGMIDAQIARLERLLTANTSEIKATMVAINAQFTALARETDDESGKELAHQLSEVVGDIWGNYHPANQDIIDKTNDIIARLSDFLKAHSHDAPLRIRNRLYELSKEGKQLSGEVNGAMENLMQCKLSKEQRDKFDRLRLKDRWSAFQTSAFPLITAFQAPEQKT